MPRHRSAARLPRSRLSPFVALGQQSLLVPNHTRRHAAHAWFRRKISNKHTGQWLIADAGPLGRVSRQEGSAAPTLYQYRASPSTSRQPGYTMDHDGPQRDITDAAADALGPEATEAELAAFRQRLSNFGLGEGQPGLLTGEVPAQRSRKRR